jgi:hypothetical protein
MKKLAFLLSILVPSILIISCVSEESLKEYNTHIALAGKIDNKKDASVQLFKQISPTELKLVEKKALNDQGEYHFVLIDSLANYYRLISGNQEWNLYLSPKDSIYFTFDANDPFHTVRVKGKRGKHENNYLNAKDFFTKEKLITDSLFNQTEKEFHKEMKYIKKQYLFALNEANVQHQDFRRDERIAIDYFIGKLMYLYPRMNQNIAQNQVALSDNYYEFLSALAVENSDFIDIPEYVDFMSNLILFEYSENKSKDSTATLNTYISKYFKETSNIRKIKKIMI